MDEGIFDEGWREPGDDCERLASYLVLGFGTLAGAGLTVWGLGMLGDPRLWGAGLFVLAVGGAMTTGGIVFFRQELRHWNLRGLNAERIVAGLFLLGFAVGIIGVETQDPTAAAVLLGLGGAILIGTLAIGLICAYAPRLFVRRYRLDRAYVVSRFAYDDKLQEIPDPVAPFESSWTPCVRVRTEEGKLLVLRATTNAYEFAEPGCVGEGFVRGQRLQRFVPHRRPGKVLSQS